MIYRRSSLRFPCKLEATCCPAGDKGSASSRATVCNISTMGIGLLSGRSFPPGSLLAVELHAQGKEDLIDAQVKVFHVRPAGPDAWYYGCRFIQPLAASEWDALLK
jgi:hypothetical protein